MTTRSKLRTRASAILEAQQTVLVVLILGLSVYLSLATSTFLTVGEFKAISLGLAIDTILVVGMTFVIIGGGFDLSVGSILGLSAVTVGLAIQHGAPWPVAAFIALCAGLLAGAVNGLLIAYVGVSALIATLGTLYAFHGLALVITSATTLNLPNNPLVTFFGQGGVLGVPVPVLFAAATVAIGAVMLRYSRHARYVCFVGSNSNAAGLAGLPVKRTIFATYVVMGGLAGIAGILSIGRVGNASADLGRGVELAVITAVILGGARLGGGEGSVVGSTLAVVFLALIATAQILLLVPVFWQELTVGTVLVIAVVFNLLKIRLRERTAIRHALHTDGTTPPRQIEAP